MADGRPFLGVPGGAVRVENPDGVFTGSDMSHSLYDRDICVPVIPGDVEYARDVPVLPGTRD